MKVKPTLNSADIELLKTVFVTKEELDTKFDVNKQETFNYVDGRIKAAQKEIIHEVDERQQSSLSKAMDKLFTRIDPILKEVVASREERVIINARLEKLEQKHIN